MFTSKNLMRLVFLFWASSIILSDGSLLANDTLKINPSNKFLFGISYQSGRILKTNPDVQQLRSGELLLEKFNAFSFSILRQTCGEKEWQERFNYPTYGIGINLTNFSMPDKMGTPISLYGHFSSAFFRFSKLSFLYEFNAGIAFNFEPYEVGKNEYYGTLGSERAVYLSPRLGLRYQLSNSLEFSGMLSITHFSNAALKLPNRGINMVAPSLQLRYSTQKETRTFIHQPPPSFTRRNELLLHVYMANKNRPFKKEKKKDLSPYSQQNFLEYGVRLTFNRQVAFHSKIGLGMDLLIDNAVKVRYTIDELAEAGGNISIRDKLAFSVFPSYELLVHKTSLFIQLGAYLSRKQLSYQSPVLYQRIGIQQQLTDKLFIGAGVRSYRFHVADFVEWTVSYKLTKH